MFDFLVPIEYLFQFSSVQLLSRVWLFATPWIAACQASLSITISMFMSGKNHYFLLMSYYLGIGLSLSQSSVKEFSIHSVMNELITHACRIIPSFLVDNIVVLCLISVLKNVLEYSLQHCVSFRHIVKWFCCILHIHIFMVFRLFSHIGSHRILKRVPCAMQWVFLLIYLI